MRKKFLIALVAGAILSLIIMIVPADAATSFSDLKNTHPNYKAIQWLGENGIIQGYGDGTFRPDSPINRAELLKIIFLANGLEQDSSKPFFAADLFPDTPASAWYAKYVALAKKRGTIIGYPDGNFKPGNFINKAEAYKIILKEFFSDNTLNTVVSSAAMPDSKQLNPGSIPADVKATDWFFTYINFAAIKNLYNTGHWSTTENSFNFYPGKAITRGELSELIYRAKAFSDNFYGNVTNAQTKFDDSLVPFMTSLFNFAFERAGGAPAFKITDPLSLQVTFGYYTKYPKSLLVVNNNKANTLEFYAGSDLTRLDISIVARENPQRLSLDQFYKSQPQGNLFAKSVSFEALKVNLMPAIWFHKITIDTGSQDELVAIAFQNVVIEIRDFHSRHQDNGVFNAMMKSIIVEDTLTPQ